MSVEKISITDDFNDESEIIDLFSAKYLPGIEEMNENLLEDRRNYRIKEYESGRNDTKYSVAS